MCVCISCIAVAWRCSYVFATYINGTERGYIIASIGKRSFDGATAGGCFRVGCHGNTLGLPRSAAWNIHPPASSLFRDSLFLFSLAQSPLCFSSSVLLLCLSYFFSTLLPIIPLSSQLASRLILFLFSSYIRINPPAILLSSSPFCFPCHPCLPFCLFCSLDTVSPTIHGGGSPIFLFSPVTSSNRTARIVHRRRILFRHGELNPNAV